MIRSVGTVLVLLVSALDAGYALLRAFGFSQAEAISRIRAARPEVVFGRFEQHASS